MYQEEIDKNLLEAAQEVENKYQEFFRKKMSDYGIKSPNELSYDDKKKFFDEVEKEWHNVNENAEEDSLNEDFNDVYASLYNNLVNPQINKVGDIVTFPYDGYDTSFEIKLIVEPVKFGDSSNYYMKVVNGPHEGEDIVLSQDYVQECMNNKSLHEDTDIIDILDEIAGQVDEDEELDEVNLDKLLNIKEDEEELNESVDFDVTEMDNDKLEKALKMFLDKKAEDGEDYELTSKGKKLILKIYNNKFVNDVKKILG